MLFDVKLSKINNSDVIIKLNYSVPKTTWSEPKPNPKLYFLFHKSANLCDLTSALKPEDCIFSTVFQNSHESNNSKIWKLINRHFMSGRSGDNLYQSGTNVLLKFAWLQFCCGLVLPFLSRLFNVYICPLLPSYSMNSLNSNGLAGADI